MSVLRGSPYKIGETPTALKTFLDKEYQVNKPSVELVEFLTRAKLPWMYYDEAKGKIIMIVDNHLMSTYRACPQHFIHAHVEGWRMKGINVSGVSRNWFLEFGIILHKMLEEYYLSFREPNFDAIKFCTERACAAWHEQEMDVLADHKEYQKIGGLHGFVGLLVQYTTLMSAQNEKLRVLGTEIAFGRNLEVPISLGEDREYYLAGRMDLIVDDGYFICPMDHKTMGTFRGEPGLKFETEEGPTGYIYALKTVLPQFISEEQILKRDCTKILMNLICKEPKANANERFLRIAIRKTVYQLEQYQKRMYLTCESLYRDMESYALGLPPQRNTQVCQNWMHLQCPYFNVCRQGSADGVQATLNNAFVQVKIWNTEEI